MQPQPPWPAGWQHGLTQPELEALGARLATTLRPGAALLLTGPLGAGKTTLARAILRAALNDPACIVPSPSFTLVQVYDGPGFPIAHLDLWRLAGPGDLRELGWDELTEGAVIVEWAEKLGALAPDGATWIEIALAADTGRDVRIREGRPGLCPGPAGG